MTELQIISKQSDSKQSPTTALSSVHVKTPRRILHFSDGVLEEYSTDDEVDSKNKDEKGQGPLTMIDYVLMCGNKVLATCDYVGEKIAAALGITTPKYNYEIEQFKKIQKERIKAEEDEEKSTGGWMQQAHSAQCKHPEKDDGPIMSQENLQKY